MLLKDSSNFSKHQHKILLKNFLSLTILQGANYILPLATLPYIIQMLGVEHFGLLIFANAFVYYFSVIVEYGFNLSATRNVSIHRKDPQRLNELASKVFTTKIYLFIITFVIFSCLVFGFGKLHQNALILYLTFGAIFGQMLFAQWFFQGIEEMQYITYLTIISKILYALGIFLFVHHPRDVWVVPFLNFVSLTGAGTLSILLMVYKYKIKLHFCSINKVMEEIKSGWHIFSAQVFTLIYTNSSIMILGIFSSETIVGYYAIADRIVKIVVSIFGPFQGAFYPYINKLITVSKNEAILKLHRLTLYAAAAMGVLSIALFFGANTIVFLVSGEYIPQSRQILQILAPLPLVLTLAKIFSFNYLISFGQKAFLPKIYLTTAIAGMASFLIAVPFYGAVGMAYCVLFSEIFATVYMYRIVKTRIVDAK